MRPAMPVHAVTRKGYGYPPGMPPGQPQPGQLQPGQPPQGYGYPGQQPGYPGQPGMPPRVLARVDVTSNPRAR